MGSGLGGRAGKERGALLLTSCALGKLHGLSSSTFPEVEKAQRVHLAGPGEGS